MVNKKAVIIVTIITIIIVGVMLWFGINSIEKPVYTFEDVAKQEVNEEENQENSSIKKDDEEKESDKDEEKIEENKKEDIENDENKSNESKNNDNDEKDLEDSNEKSDEDIAIELAKKEWGEDDKKVYYYVDEKLSDSKYVITVRSKETTAGLRDYCVNIKTKKVERY